MDKPQEPSTADLAAAVAGADEGRRRRDCSTEVDHGNPAGGFALLLHPLRRYVLAGAIVLMPVLIILSIVR